jgi:signal transduction histidine kinase
MVPLAWRRRQAVWAAVAFSALVALQPALDDFFFGSSTTTPFVASLLMAYTCGRHLSGRRLWATGALLIAAVLSGILASQTYEGPGDLLWIAILFLPPLIAGQAIRNRVALRHELREKAERIEAEYEVAAQRAVEEERNRIASELQAVVANGVSAMVVQAEAVPRLLAAGDPARAGQAFQVIEETGRDALAEMRRLLGVLRREGQRAELAPQPGLARLGALMERLGEQGLALELQEEGERRELAQGIDLTAFRILQEALDAAAAANAPNASVTIRYGPRDLELEVRDDREAAPAPPLTALRERVTLYGGHVRGAMLPAGGYLLEARLPARAPSSPAAEPVGEPA